MKVLKNGGLAFSVADYVMDIAEYEEITLLELADRMGVSREYLSDYVSEEKELTRDFVKKFSKYSGVSEKFWGRIEEKYNDKIKRELDSK